MGDQRTRLWLGIGTCILLGGGPAVAGDVEAPRTHASEQALLAAVGSRADAYSHGGGGGEGGEGGEGGSAMGVFASGGEGGEGGEAGPPATDHPGVFYSQLAFMLGHMHVGRELFRQGDTGIGGTHLGHPAAEHLDTVRQALEQRGLEDVVREIERLARKGAESTDWAQVEGQWQATRAAIVRAMNDVDPAHRNNAEFIGKVLLAILFQSRHEYEEAIRDGRFVLDHEYHDSRGFMQIGRELLEQHADVLEAADADAYSDLVARFEEAMEAWPGAHPPAAPTLSVSELYGRVAAAEFAISRF